MMLGNPVMSPLAAQAGTSLVGLPLTTAMQLSGVGQNQSANILQNNGMWNKVAGIGNAMSGFGNIGEEGSLVNDIGQIASLASSIAQVAMLF